MWELDAQLVMYESKALEHVLKNALFWCLGNFVAESKGSGRYWTYERQLCGACSETRETSRGWCERSEKIMNQQMKKRYYRNMCYFTDSRIFWTHNMLNALTICLSDYLLIIREPKETWKDLSTHFHTWDRNLYNTLSSELCITMHTHNSSFPKAWKTTWVLVAQSQGF